MQTELTITVDQILGEPTNELRSARIETLLDCYSKIKGENPDAEDTDTKAQDLLTDLMHWSQANGVNFADMQHWATINFDAEAEIEDSPLTPT